LQEFCKLQEPLEKDCADFPLEVKGSNFLGFTLQKIARFAGRKK
jgi:hypothetical protein